MTTGNGKPTTRLARSKPACTIAGPSGPPPRSTLRSNPAENTPSRPVSTTTARSRSAASKAAFSSANIAGESALTLPSSIVIVATPPSSVYLTSPMPATVIVAVLRNQAPIDPGPYADPVDHRRLRWSAAVALIVLSSLVLGAPASARDAESITKYDAKIEIHGDGTMRVTE